ncbi:DUF4363 family protein [Clostridium sp. SHJSY1]|uniref:DUF4363 family protein n=1 Tax=Clostridium sp. SHJSY1 TaxID=2942483 RepID=UPI002876AEB8|nr:DUF4363 family protein [Clostridium sp. SHJSY1]MDS0528215.1 DUF4363 family protein [Clostridium sp. SHJSY1]
MKSTLMSIFIFLALLCFVFFANNALIKLCDTISKSSEEIEALINNKDWERAYSQTDEIINLIDENQLLSSVYINHTELDNLMDEAVELSLYIDCRDHTESVIAVNSLKNFAKNIKHLHNPNIENIF